MKLHLIISIMFTTQVAGLFIRPSTLVATSDRRRQVAQPAQPTLPSNYWWPYPSLTWGGGGASTATTIVPATTAMPSIVSPTMVVSVPSPTISSDSTSSTMVSSTSTSDTSSSSTTSISSSSSISDVSTTTMDPQQTNPTSHVHVSQLLIPIVASIAGVVVGAFVLAWLLCRCCTRRRREYTMRRTLRRRRDGGDAEKGWKRVSTDNWEDRSRKSWWNKMFSTRGEEIEDVVPGPRYVGVENEVEGRDELRAVVESGSQLQEEFSLASKPRRSTCHSLLSQPLIPSRSTSTTALALAKLYDDESDEDEEFQKHNDREQVPWESLRHKSIKRAILAKVDEERKWTDSMRGMRAANANAAKGGVGRRQTHAKCDSDFWVSSASLSDARDGGFRIVAESPPQIPTPPGKTWTSLASSFPFFSMGSSGPDEEELEKVEDRYTPAPARTRSGSKNQSRRGSITSPVGAVLLRSPPTVTSPEMESALCFTPFLTRTCVENVDSGITRTYRLRTDRAMRRVEAIVESGWTERGVA